MWVRASQRHLHTALLKCGGRLHAVVVAATVSVCLCLCAHVNVEMSIVVESQ